MSSRLRSDIFVAALIRRAEVAGAFAMLRRRGAAEAGAIFIKVDRLDGFAALFGPAAQSEVGDDGMHRFRLLQKEDWVSPGDVEARIAREVKFDSDLWLVEIEDREGRCFVELA
jgi:hypothetical protein